MAQEALVLWNGIVEIAVFSRKLFFSAYFGKAFGKFNNNREIRNQRLDNLTNTAFSYSSISYNLKRIPHYQPSLLSIRSEKPLQRSQID